MKKADYPVYWEEYLDHLKKVHLSKVAAVEARNKEVHDEQYEKVQAYKALPWYQRMLTGDPDHWSNYWEFNLMNYPTPEEPTIEGYYTWLVKREADKR